MDPSLTALNPTNDPPKLPMGVLTADTMYTSFMTVDLMWLCIEHFFDSWLLAFSL
jgi:hypothetical protein